jgi:hypothetical protein
MFLSHQARRAESNTARIPVRKIPSKVPAAAAKAIGFPNF